ncbi:hypothetical protein PCANC_00260 [Puccinia coronata f. sp. avenae]|uniref:Cytidine deaminase n=1 Tax=Puccinia coronata f. sp. avenae TaxID=200324 RepID=A0A2N5UZZ1_9BASI|nr:hypothetical protein PCASD_23126 [Puccinia coronata f. sp. avenae]PLW43320.1 hypothetical protein PCASD_06108 [Puccinia coronata f. sp. avenae]PLW58702.1 hypothetical protein PCANC_00260 [Puccinia coronata f. sp. avenae]
MGSIPDEQITRLCLAALRARQFSYSPYSNFRVGAAILTVNDEVITGCNVENAAFSPGSCAERTAFVKAVSEGKREFKALAVATDIDGPCSPCGVCRQFAREFCSLEMPIYMAHSSFASSEDLATKLTTRTLGELLPMSFGPGDLERKA